MKTSFLVISALTATALFAQDPGRPPMPPGMMGGFGPGGGFGPRGQMRGMHRGEPRDDGDGMGMRGRGMGRQEFRLGRLLEDPNVRQQLGLTTEQAAKIRQQESDFQKARIRNRADLQIKRMDLRDLLAADKADRAAIDSKLQEIGASQLALEKSAIDFQLAMRDALTPAQRQRLQRMMTERGPFGADGAAAGGTAAPRGPQGGGRGGRGAGGPANPPNPPNQTPPNR
jgi:Spy/CpxP family protein refolding chaperone